MVRIGGKRDREKEVGPVRIIIPKPRVGYTREGSRRRVLRDRGSDGLLLVENLTLYLSAPPSDKRAALYNMLTSTSAAVRASEGRDTRVGVAVTRCTEGLLHVYRYPKIQSRDALSPMEALSHE